MIDASMQNQLLYIDLPLVAGAPPVQVLVLVISSNEQSCTLLLQDDDEDPVTRQLLGEQIPPIYNARPAGVLDELFAQHPQSAADLLEASQLGHSSLTMARALRLMLEEPGLRAEQALIRAQAIGKACAHMVARQHNLAAAMGAGARRA